MIANYIGETTNCEKKEKVEKNKVRNWLKTVSAFANGDGGVLIFGIANDDEIIGLENCKDDLEFISEKIKTQIEPVPVINLENKKIEDKNIILVEVESGTQTPYYYIGNRSRIAYIRIGNESVSAQNYNLNNLILKGTNKTFDSLETDIEIDKVSFSKLKATYYQNTKLEFLNSDFESFGLVKNGKLTNAGALFADERLVYQSRIFCTRWNGLDKTSGLMEALDDREIEGGIIYQLQEAMSFIASNSKKMWKKTDNSRLEFPEYPERAVQEALVNAIIHRDYGIIGSEVHIDIYDDRMEIISPGGMYGGGFIQKMDTDTISSKRRNPIISDLFTRLKLMERRGSGLKKIRDAYINSDNFVIGKEVMFFSEIDVFRVVMKNLNYKENKKIKKVIKKQNQKEKEKIIDIQTNKILKFLEENEEITRKEVEELLKVKENRSRTILRKLISENRIIKVGKVKNIRYILKTE